MTSHGLLFVGGLICFVLGAFALYTAPGNPTAPDVAVATPLILFMAALTTGFMLLVLVTIVRTRRRGLAFAGAYGAGAARRFRPAATGSSSRRDPTRHRIHGRRGMVARSATGSEIPSGAPIRVVGQEGLTLIVEPVPSTEPSAQQVTT